MKSLTDDTLTTAVQADGLAPFTLAGRCDRTRDLKSNPIRDLLKLVEQPDIISFAGGVPDPGNFPRDLVCDYAIEAIQAGDHDCLQYGPSIGHGGLRAALADYMADLGVPCTADNILITTGGQQGIALASSILTEADSTITVPAVTYLGALQEFRARRLRIRPLHPGQDLAPGSTYYVVPDYANPTGERLSAKARRALLIKAERSKSALIEDAAYCEFDYSGAPIPSLLAMDCALSGGIDKTRTVFCGTVSKILSPGLRVGWICAARDTIDTLVRRKECADIMTSPFNQAIVQRFFRDAARSARIEDLRKFYGHRCDVMGRELARAVGDAATWEKPKGGLFYWLTLPKDYDTEALLKRAVAEFRVAFVPGRSFVHDMSTSNQLRLSFSSVDDAGLREGVDRLARALRS